MICYILVLVIIQFLFILGILVFAWWQFSFTDSRLCKLIDDRSKLFRETDMELEEFEGEF